MFCRKALLPARECATIFLFCFIYTSFCFVSIAFCTTTAPPFVDVCVYGVQTVRGFTVFVVRIKHAVVKISAYFDLAMASKSSHTNTQTLLLTLTVPSVSAQTLTLTRV